MTLAKANNARPDFGESGPEEAQSGSDALDEDTIEELQKASESDIAEMSDAELAALFDRHL